MRELGQPNLEEKSHVKSRIQHDVHDCGILALRLLVYIRRTTETAKGNHLLRAYRLPCLAQRARLAPRSQVLPKRVLFLVRFAGKADLESLHDAHLHEHHSVQATHFLTIEQHIASEVGCVLVA